MFLNDDEIVTFNAEQFLERVIDKLFKIYDENTSSFDKAVYGHEDRDQFVQRLQRHHLAKNINEQSISKGADVFELINLTYSFVYDAKHAMSEHKNKQLNNKLINVAYVLGGLAWSDNLHKRLREESSIELADIYFRYKERFDSLRMERVRSKKHMTAREFYKPLQKHLEQLFIRTCQELEDSHYFKVNIVITRVLVSFEQEVLLINAQENAEPSTIDRKMKPKKVQSDPRLTKRVVEDLISQSIDPDVILWARKLRNKRINSKIENVIKSYLKD